MPINATATMDDDLKALGAVDLIRTIQGLLLNNTSDAVREMLKSKRIKIAHYFPQDNSFTKEDLLESPFFVAKGLNAVSRPQVRTNTPRFSGNISRTARAVLKDFYGYNVSFAKWDDFETEMDLQDLSSIGKLPEDVTGWDDLVYALLYKTFDREIEGLTGEVQELAFMHSDLKQIFNAFDFAMEVKNGSDEDVNCSVITTNHKFLFMEGKESACLPGEHCTNGHHLCSFGFATKVARIQWKAPESPSTGKPPDWHINARQNNSHRGRLQAFLKVSGESGKIATTSVKPSERTNAILEGPQVVADAVSAVHALFQESKIRPHDPVNLWAAVMQACHYSIKQNRAVTIVQSARMWWFIQFGEDDGCVARISTTRKVGSRHFLSTVMKFLKYARDSENMEERLRKKWEVALVESDHDRTKTTSKHAEATGNEETNDSPAPPAPKRSRSSSKGKNESLLPAEPYCEFTVTPTVSFDDEETGDCFGYDKFGMEIPWFDQIGDTLEVLGRGRSGEVTKVIWKAQPVALKTFILQFDDHRSLESVYQDELDVFWALKELWGKHVPELLFHKFWPTSPLIGVELGEPLPDDMSEWSEADLQKADETVQKIEELGWRQTDVRGANFVRLKGDKIAMIDFESMEKVAK